MMLIFIPGSIISHDNMQSVIRPSTVMREK